MAERVLRHLMEVAREQMAKLTPEQMSAINRGVFQSSQIRTYIYTYASCIYTYTKSQTFIIFLFANALPFHTGVQQMLISKLLPPVKMLPACSASVF